LFSSVESARIYGFHSSTSSTKTMAKNDNNYVFVDGLIQTTLFFGGS
jgi:hypothetical protein